MVSVGRSRILVLIRQLDRTWLRGRHTLIGPFLITWITKLTCHHSIGSCFAYLDYAYSLNDLNVFLENNTPISIKSPKIFHNRQIIKLTMEYSN